MYNFNDITVSGSVTDGSQTEKLVLASSLTGTDKIYICKVKSALFADSPLAEITANVDVFSKLQKFCP